MSWCKDISSIKTVKQIQIYPDDFIINHISGSFVEMVLWWVKNGMKESPTKLDNYFHVIEPII